MKKILLLPLVLLFLQCTSTSERSMADRTVDQTRRRANALVTKKYGLRTIGSGGGATPDGKQTSISVVYERKAKEPQSKACMRAMVIDAAETLLREIHQDEKLQPYLNETPYPLNGIRVWIIQQKPNFEPFIYPYPTSTCLGNGRLRFLYREVGKLNFSSAEEETWDEAVEKVKAEPCEQA